MHHTLYQKEYLFTSESVSPGHPDKLCDQLSDTILDLYLAADPDAHVAVETLVAPGNVVVAGEVRGPGTITSTLIEEAVRLCIERIGYAPEHFDAERVAVHHYLHSQSAEIAKAVDATAERAQGAGDQGLMFGYACDETLCFMPAPIFYAHRILERLHQGRLLGSLKGLGPDAKSQVTLVYQGYTPVAVHSLVVSTQHVADISLDQVRALVLPEMIAVFPQGWITQETQFYINPSGSFILGGPGADSGLTGRKIIVDSYGGAAPHGGGAFSGKDPSKVDRSAAYACRYLAKNVVAAGLAKRCTIQIAYAIGVAFPLSFYVNTHGSGSGNINDNDLGRMLATMIDLSPTGIQSYFHLKCPIYLPTATFGHFGREPTINGHFPWEKLDLVEELQARAASLTGLRMVSAMEN